MSDTNTPTPSQNPLAINDISKLVTTVEEELLRCIVDNMKHRQMSLQQAHELARDFMKQLPMKDKEDLLNKLKELGTTYQPAKKVYVELAAPYEEEKREKILNAMRDHIKSGNIEEALAIAKGATQ